MGKTTHRQRPRATLAAAALFSWALPSAAEPAAKPPAAGAFAPEAQQAPATSENPSGDTHIASEAASPAAAFSAQGAPAAAGAQNLALRLTPAPQLMPPPASSESPPPPPLTLGGAKLVPEENGAVPYWRQQLSLPQWTDAPPARLQLRLTTYRWNLDPMVLSAELEIAPPGEGTTAATGVGGSAREADGPTPQSSGDAKVLLPVGNMGPVKRVEPFLSVPVGQSGKTPKPHGLRLGVQGKF